MPAQRTQTHKRYESQFRMPGLPAGQRLLVGLACIFVLTTVTFALVKALLGVPNSGLPTVYAVGRGVAIFDRYNKYVTTVYADRDRKPVSLTQISMNVRNALLAAEDHNFYRHHGIDLIGIGRAFVSNVKAGHVVEGGSTITQQLVRNLYLDVNDRSFKRKLAEVVLAIDVENNYSKAKILETYLNEVYFGNGVYGIERASQVYFNRHAADLTLAESAFIAGLIKAPSDLGSRINRQAAIDRQRQVLDKMVAYGLATQHESDVAKRQPLHFARSTQAGAPYPYYVATVLRTLNENMPENQIWGKGLRVYTTLDQEAQKAAETMLNRGIDSAPRGINQGALVCENVKDGSVIALVGGVGDYRNHQFNRALARHTVGSSFKPFVYLAAAISGAIGPASSIDDSPISFNMGFGKQYTPRNFDGKFLGTISIRDALALSRNVCSVRVADAVGVGRVILTARAAGITAPMDNNLSLALGSCAISPMEMATAYATLARYGQYVSPRLIRRVDSAQGESLKQFPASSSQTLPQEQVCEIVDIMTDVVQRGTGTQAKLDNIAVAGKTGTADKARDIWFVGFTPDTVTAVWGGNDRYLPVRGNVTGGIVMAKIWHDYMTRFYQKHPAPSNGFIPPRTPFMQQASSSINSSVVNEAQQYEEGLKEPAVPDGEASSQPDQSQTNNGQSIEEQQTPAPTSAPQPGNYVREPEPSVQQPAADWSRTSREEAPNDAIRSAPREDSRSETRLESPDGQRQDNTAASQQPVVRPAEPLPNENPSNNVSNDERRNSSPPDNQ